MFSVAAFSGLNYILLASSYCEKVGAANAAFSLPLETLMTDRHSSVQSIAKKDGSCVCKHRRMEEVKTITIKPLQQSRCKMTSFSLTFKSSLFKSRKIQTV